MLTTQSQKPILRVFPGATSYAYSWITQAPDRKQMTYLNGPIKESLIEDELQMFV